MHFFLSCGILAIRVRVQGISRFQVSGFRCQRHGENEGKIRIKDHLEAVNSSSIILNSSLVLS